MSQLRRALIVAPHFAPINAPDGHRIRLNLPHYRRYGWDTEVLSVRPEHRPDWRDDSLLETLPRDVLVHRCGAVPLKWSRRFGFGTMGWRAYPHLAAMGSALLRRGGFDLVVFSTTQFNVLTLGVLWKKWFKVPFVIDLQDPWHNDYYQRAGAPPPPGGWKYRVAHWHSRILEPFCLRRSAAISVVSDDYLGVLARRYGWFAGKPVATLPFAAPLNDFPGTPSSPASDRKICACVGALNPAFRSALDCFFSEVAVVRRDTGGEFPWRFEFHGTSYAGESHAARLLAAESADRHDVGDLTVESPRRLAYLDSLRHMRSADLLLVLGSDDASYAPSRLATVCAAGRPVLVVAREDSLLIRRARMIPGVQCLTYEQAGANLRGGTSLATILEAPSRIPAPSLPEDYSPQALASRECTLWTKAIEGR